MWKRANAERMTKNDCSWKYRRISVVCLKHQLQASANAFRRLLLSVPAIALKSSLEIVPITGPCPGTPVYETELDNVNFADVAERPTRHAVAFFAVCFVSNYMRHAMSCPCPCPLFAYQSRTQLLQLWTGEIPAGMLVLILVVPHAILVSMTFILIATFPIHSLELYLRNLSMHPGVKKIWGAFRLSNVSVHTDAHF